MKNMNRVSLSRLWKLAIPVPGAGRTGEEQTVAALRSTRDLVDQKRIVDRYVRDWQNPQYASSAAKSLTEGLVSIAAGVHGLAEDTVLNALDHVSNNWTNDLQNCVRNAHALCKNEVGISKKAFALSVATFASAASLLALDLPTCGVALAIASVASASVSCKLRNAPQRAEDINRVADTLITRYRIEFFKNPTVERAEKLCQVVQAMHSKPNNTQAIRDVIARFIPNGADSRRPILEQAASLACLGEENTPSAVINGPRYTPSEREVYVDTLNAHRVEEAGMIRGLAAGVLQALDLESDSPLKAYFYYSRLIAALESKRVFREPADFNYIIDQLKNDSKGGYVDTVRQEIIDIYNADVRTRVALIQDHRNRAVRPDTSLGLT